MNTYTVHKMVKFTLRNPKLEFRNPKQIQNPNFQITKMHRLEAYIPHFATTGFWNFAIGGQPPNASYE